MEQQKHILALEIGSSKIKGAVGVLEDGILTVNAIEEEKLVDSVSHGLIINVETVATKAMAIIRKLENRVSPFKARQVYIGIGGRSFMSSPREIERQLPMEEEITTELLDQLRQEALSTALADREVVTVVDGEFFVDHRPCLAPRGTYGRNIRAKYNLITCRLQVMKNLRRVVSERLGLKIAGVFVRQLAEADLVLSNDERLQGCMLVDFGAETTTVSIYRNGALHYMATLPMGSRNITRDITSIHPLEERAERLKIAGGNAMPTPQKQIIDGIDFTEINSYVAARAAEIVANINEQIRYAGLRPDQLPGGIILVGNGSKLKGFKDLIEKLTKIKKVHVALPSPTVKISDGRIAPYDAIDVISILNAAAKSDDPVDCMINPLAKAADETAKEPEEKPAGPEITIEQDEEEEIKTPSSILETESDDEFYGPDAIKGTKRSIFKRFSDKITRMLSEDEIDDELDDK